MSVFLRNVVSATIAIITIFSFSAPNLLASSDLDTAHGNLACTECHLTQPDPTIDTVDTVAFVTPTSVDLCVSCHSRNTSMELTSSSTELLHYSYMTMTQEMHTFYVNWLSLYNQENGTSLTGFNLIDNGNGTYSLDCLSCHSIRGGFTYPDIPMDNAEMCVACHGGAGNYDPGVTRTVRSSIPRILYNPQHLGVTDGSGVQFPPPSNPNYDGPPPEDGDTVSGQTPLPVTFFREFHTNPNTEVHYNYRVEIYGPQFDNFIEADARPLIWYTGIDSTSRWANEKQMYHWDTSSFPGGSYTVDLIPFDTQDPSIEGTPYTLHLELEGSLTPVEMVQQLINLVTSLNLQSGIENSLDAKLDAAEKALSDLQENNDVAAINALQAFINATEAQRGNHILEADTDAFIAAAQEIIAVLSSV